MSKSTYRWLIVGVIAALFVLGLVVYMMLFRPTAVPDVRMKTLDEAKAELVTAGLEPGVASKVATDTVGEGLVVSQDPAARTSAPRRSAVDLVVAERPMAVKVPTVVGKDAAFAEESLSTLLFVPRRVDLFDAEGEEGSVVAQLPEPGALWTTGRPVAFAVAAGPDDGSGVVVPGVVGKRLEAALADVEAVGLVPYAVVKDVNEADLNEVVEQLPAAGALVKPGQTILLYLELP